VDEAYRGLERELLDGDGDGAGKRLWGEQRGIVKSHEENMGKQRWMKDGVLLKRSSNGWSWWTERK
jgi:hypothetical protein